MFIAGILYSFSSLAVTLQSVTINNVTKSNIHYEYELCISEASCPSGGGVSTFVDEPATQNIDLSVAHTSLLRVNYVEEIDYDKGNIIPGGARGDYMKNECVTRAGQTISFDLINKKQIICRVSN